MKNKKLSLAVLIMAITAFVSVTVISCKKDRDEQRTTNKEQEIQSADNMDDYLISFKEKLLSAQKGGETVCLEQAQQDLGNLLNYDFGDANYATNIFQNDTLKGKVKLTNGQVELAQLALTYLNMAQQVREKFHQVNLPNKSVYSITSSFDNSDKNNDVDVTIVLTTRGYSETEIERSFTGWRSGNRKGTCEGLLVGVRGAPEVVTDRLNDNMGEISCANGGRVYFTEQETSYKDSKDSDMLDNNTDSGHKLYFGATYYQNLDLSTICLSEAELNRYYNNATNLINTHGNTFYPIIPSDHLALQYYISYMEDISGTGLKIAYWRIFIYHGKANCTDSQPDL